MDIESDSYVIRLVALDAIGADCDVTPVAEADRRERRAALHFDAPIAAAEVLLALPATGGCYRLVAGAERISAARAHGRGMVLAAVACSADAARRVLPRWNVHHAA